VFLYDLGYRRYFATALPCLRIYRFTGFQPAGRIMKAAKHGISTAAFLSRSAVLAFVGVHGYNLAL
jgi:hypothetical protein